MFDDKLGHELKTDQHIFPNKGNYFEVYDSKWIEGMYSARNLEMAIRFSLKSWLSERLHRPEMSQIKAEISLRTNLNLNFHKNLGCQWIPDFYDIRF